jgi:hypothetical protein
MEVGCSFLKTEKQVTRLRNDEKNQTLLKAYLERREAELKPSGILALKRGRDLGD